MAATATTPAYVDVSCIVKGGAPVNVYQVTMSVAGKYYAGSSSDVLTVFDPTQGGATGGGTITRANGSIGAFAFAATRLKSNQVQGKMLYIETGAAGNQTVLKGNAMSTMTISGNTASVTGKATLNGTGNFSYVLSVTDANTNQPSSATDPDMYGQRVTDPGGAPVAGLSVDKTVVTSGNVFVGK
jgi:hypothetical protein